MFATLTSEPVRVSTRSDEPVLTTSWMSGTIPVPRGRRISLGIGVWIIRVAEWLPASTLDIGEFVPPITDVEPRRTIVQRPAWHALANCVAVPDSDDIFFGVDDIERPALSPTATKRARTYCAGCPVTRDCLTWALSMDERFGIWAGTTGRQRRVMRYALKRGETTIAQLVDRILGDG